MKIKFGKVVHSKIIFIVIILFLCINYKTAFSQPNTITINEIMIDPVENDNYNEWIEIYNPTNQSINISGWSIKDNHGTDFLEGDYDHGNGTLIIPPQGYAIISDHGTSIDTNFSISNEAIRLYVDDSAIGNGLGNTKDYLILQNKTDTIVDYIKWGYNYSEIPGKTYNTSKEGNTLSRYQNIDTNSSYAGFYESRIPTPGAQNILTKKPSFYIIKHPLFMPKIQNNSECSLPFAIKLNITNFDSNETLQIKSYIVGETTNAYPATQTWDKSKWEYSNYYTSTIKTDENGNWSDWIMLRFKKDYKEYQNNIQNNTNAYLKIKIKKTDNSTEEITKEIYLLDLDETHYNGIKGGYIVGVLEENNSFLEKQLIIIENKTGITTGIYLTENNDIDEDSISQPGYYKVACPIDINYTLKIYNEHEDLFDYIGNINVEYGDCGIDIYSVDQNYKIEKHGSEEIQLIIKNIGSFDDIIDIKIKEISNGWQGVLEKQKVSLKTNEIEEISLDVSPFIVNQNTAGFITIQIISEKDISKTDEITFLLEILGSDLEIKQIKIYDEQKNQTNKVYQGEEIKIKAFLKNIGNMDALNIDVMFYYDKICDENFIGKKNYETIGKYQKYPSVKWDTTDIKAGIHKIIVSVDEENGIDELDETNNILFQSIEITDTSPSFDAEKIVFSEIYYHTHPNIKNEFFAVFNPANKSIDISGFYITNQATKTKLDQNKLIFPNNTVINSNETFYITQKNIDFRFETGKNADFEYYVDSDETVPQMINNSRFVISNKGGGLALKNQYNHTIDFVCYGNISIQLDDWEGMTVPSTGEGVILKRNFDKNNHPVDTDNCSDWVNKYRRYIIGQSDFKSEEIFFNGTVKIFVSPDCSFKVITDELRNAKKSVYLNVYEFTSFFLCDELVEVLLRNVSVKVFLEGSPIGGISDEEKYLLNRITTYGGEIRFIKNNVEDFGYKRYRFNHAKYLIIDNSTVIVESCNWADTGIPIESSFGNREWGIVIKNEDAAGYFLELFFEDYNTIRGDILSFSDMDFYISSDFVFNKKIYRGDYKNSFDSLNVTGSFSIKPVISPDNSYKMIESFLDSAEKSIFVQQLYIYKEWDDGVINPFVNCLVNKSKQGVDVKVILNYNQFYDTTNEKCNQTFSYLCENGVKVKFVYSNWSVFINVHNKGVVVDNKSVLISSINWNENSVMNNRETGIIITNDDVAEYYAEVFFYDWSLKEINEKQKNISSLEEKFEEPENKNTIYIGSLFTLTFILVAQDWRKRKW